MISSARLKAALEMRDVGLAVLKMAGKPEPGMGNNVAATRGTLMLSVRTPFSGRWPEPSEYDKYLGASDPLRAEWMTGKGELVRLAD